MVKCNLLSAFSIPSEIIIMKYQQVIQVADCCICEVSEIFKYIYIFDSGTLNPDERKSVEVFLYHMPAQEHYSHWKKTHIRSTALQFLPNEVCQSQLLPLCHCYSCSNHWPILHNGLKTGGQMFCSCVFVVYTCCQLLTLTVADHFISFICLSDQNKLSDSLNSV